MAITTQDTPGIYNYIHKYLKDKDCMHEIDILNINMSNLLHTLPSFNLFPNSVENRDMLDQVIYEFLLNNITNIDLENTSIKSVYNTTIDKITEYNEVDSLNIDYDRFSNYYVELYNLVTGTIQEHTKGYSKVTQYKVLDNITQLDYFYAISDISVNTDYDRFMFRINIALFRRKRDGRDKRDRSYWTKI